METQSTDGASAELRAVTRLLSSALAEACGAEIERANTGEMLRVEQALAVASEAARKAVDLRRKRRPPRGSASKAPAEPAPVAATDPAAVDAASRPHRIFVDSAGVQWDAFAVYPSAGGGRTRLPASFRNGWLSFDSGTERRRLSPIPEDWVSLPDEALCEACARAEPAPMRLPRKGGDIEAS